jgi:ribosome assembly protein 1
MRFRDISEGMRIARLIYFRWNSNKSGEMSDKVEGARVSILDIQASINSGFQQATQSGPLCNEPMMGVCFIVEKVEFHITDETDSLQVGLLSGQVISTMKDACRLAFLDWSSRLMLAMYSCQLQAPSEVLGKVYGVLSKRKGRILSEEMRDGTAFFFIDSMIPVTESFGFSEELWKRTSGAVSPQLVYAGFEILDIDPLWVPTTEEELEELGDKADRENLARRYVDRIRKRKGLFVEEILVKDAEKQRTHKSK